MNIKTFIINLLKIVSWPIVVLVIGWRITSLFSPKITQLVETYSGLLSDTNWDIVATVSNIIMALAAIVAAVIASRVLKVARKTWDLERLPIVHATGTFIIAKNDLPIKVLNGKKATVFRDEQILEEKNSPHTFQLINVGRGPARNVVPSVNEKTRGELLELICPPSFPIPANSGTRELAEILRVHGQRFVRENENKGGDDEIIKFKDNSNGYFYIYFEDCKGEEYRTEVHVNKINRMDNDGSDLSKVINYGGTGVELWRVMSNEKHPPCPKQNS